jgi:monooxygenase
MANDNLQQHVDVQHFDVIVIGAGLSGVDVGYHLQTYCAGKSYAILEGREAIGGTWDLFRYPGIRSDSDMYTFGYSFRPWRAKSAIADGTSILDYIRETAQAYGIDRKIRFGHRVTRAAWSSADALWTIEAERGAEKEPVRFTCSFLFACTGYYEYAGGYTPEFAGTDAFRGRIVHPQHWPQDLEYAGKNIVVIGSGATAVTIVPVMAETAARVTMLQRSPTYVVSRPSEDALANWLRRHLPINMAYGIARWRNVLFSLYFFNLCRRKPAAVKQWIVGQVRQHLGTDYDVATHFTPNYNPWDQRLCLVPDADLFRALKSGKAEVVTDKIATFTEHGIRLQSGRELKADIIVTATGLKLQMLGGMQVEVDGRPVTFAQTTNYKGVMYSDVPNLANSFGYTNASWTLKCDLTAAYVCRLINHMDKHGYGQCTPRLRDGEISHEPLIDFSSGYIQRSIAEFPRQGSKKPWRLNQNYLLDLLNLRFGTVDDGALEFARRPAMKKAA